MQISFGCNFRPRRPSPSGCLLAIDLLNSMAVGFENPTAARPVAAGSMNPARRVRRKRLPPWHSQARCASRTPPISCSSAKIILLWEDDLATSTSSSRVSSLSRTLDSKQNSDTLLSTTIPSITTFITFSFMASRAGWDRHPWMGLRCQRCSHTNQTEIFKICNTKLCPQGVYYKFSFKNLTCFKL